LQRADEVNTIQRMLIDAQTSAVILTGDPGAGKSTLAALLYRRLQLAAQAGLSAPRHLVWLSLGPHTTLPDIIAAILSSINVSSPSFLLLKPDQQISLLIQALRRPLESALVVLDQFEELLDPETSQGLVGRGAFPLFFEMLQTDIGASRFLLTSYRSPYGSENVQEMRVRSYLVSRMSIPEGVALLQQRGIQGPPEELSLIWQRCAGHAFALVLFSALVHLSGFSLSYLLNSADYQPLWRSEVTPHLVAIVYRYLNPVQCTLMRALSLFSEPVPFQGILMTITADTTTFNMPAFEHELSILSQLSLVQQSLNERNVPCYALHSLLRQYILKHYLEGSDRRSSGYLSTALGVTGPLTPIPDGPEAQEIALAAAHTRVAAYYQRLAQEHCPPREKRHGPRDIEPLLAAVRHLCLAWHWQQACDMLFDEGLHENIVQWGAWNALIGLYTAMLPPLGVLSRRNQGLIASHLGLLYGQLGDYQQSRAYYAEALAIQREIGDQHGEAITIANQGELFRSLGDWQQAYAYFEQALLLNKQQLDPLLESVLLYNLGLVHHTEKDYRRALSYYQESLKVAHSLPDQYKESLILTNIGMLLYEQGRQSEALEVLLTALRLQRSIQEPTVSSVEHFLAELEPKMDPAAFARLRQAAHSDI